MTTFLNVPQFVQRQPALTVGGVRYWIFNEKTNGLAESGAIIRIGKKLVINEGKFIAWIEGGAK